jgi:hypothetical protein
MRRPPESQAACALASAALAAAGCISACKPDEPQPPDPDTPTPAVGCDAEGAPLSLTRTTADSSLESPPWLHACTLCPASGIGLWVWDDADPEDAKPGSPVPLAAAWSGGLDCAVGMPSAPLPALPSVPASISIAAGERQGTWDFDLLVAGGRGPAPIDLGSATYLLDGDPAFRRLPSLLPPADDATFPSLLVQLGPDNGSGSHSVTLGATLPGSDEQDPCVPTVTLSSVAQEDQRQVAAPLAPPDSLPVPVPQGGPLRDGALQAFLSSDGDALHYVVLLSSVDLTLATDPQGRSPEQVCADLAAASSEPGRPVCVPCGDPRDGATGLPSCVPSVWEWASAPRLASPLVPVIPESLPAECEE